MTEDDPSDASASDRPDPVTPGAAAQERAARRARALEAARRRRRRRVAVVAGVAAGVVVGPGAVRWASGTVTPAPGRTPAETVAGYVLAQRSGDCDRLIDLLTEASRSQDGELTREEFLDLCPEALDGYRPPVGAVEVEVVDEEGLPSEDGSRAVVRREHPGYGPEREGTLVREDGAWRVEADPYVLGLGRSVDDTLHAYVDAYNAGDCERMGELVTEAPDTAEPDGGTRPDDADQLGPCAAANAADDEAPVVLSETILRELDGDRATVSAALLPFGGDPAADARVALERDGLAWLLSTPAGEPDALAGEGLLAALRRLDLRRRLVDEVALPQGTCPSYTDHGTPSSEHPSEQAGSVGRDFACHHHPELTVTVRPYASAEDARRAAEVRSADTIADPSPTSDGLRNKAATVPGVDGAFGVRTSCDAERCRGATVFAARSETLVTVTVDLYFEPDDAALATASTALRAQLARL